VARKDFFSSLFFIFLSLYVCWESLRLGFGEFSQPGPGFLSFLIGLSLGSLSLAVFLGIVLKKGLPEKGARGKTPWAPLLLTSAALLGFTLLLKTLGFVIDTFLFIFFLLGTVGKKSWAISLLMSLGVTFGTYLLFQYFLQSQLPVGPFGF